LQISTGAAGDSAGTAAGGCRPGWTTPAPRASAPLPFDRRQQLVDRPAPPPARLSGDELLAQVTAQVNRLIAERPRGARAAARGVGQGKGGAGGEEGGWGWLTIEGR
jgi:hypothetical protein